MKTNETIDLTPTWTTTMRMLILIIRNGTAEGKKAAEQELMKIATELDILENDKSNLKTNN